MCSVTGKKTQVGMNVSHSHRRTKRTFLPNLQTLKFKSEILGREFALKLSTSGLRTLVKHGGLDGYVTSTPVSRLSEDMAKIKRAIAKKQGVTAKPAAAVVKKPAYKPLRSARLVKKVENKSKTK